MISIDYTKLTTEKVAIISTCYLLIQNTYKKVNRDKRWNGWHTYTNNKGITIRFRYNRFHEYNKVVIEFSPHKLYNKGLHNANCVPFQLQLGMISATLRKLGIDKHLFCYIKICSIEIGTNFQVNRDPYFLLNSALMYGSYFFSNTEYEHYRVASNTKNKYIKAKLYVKSEQYIKVLKATCLELGFCPVNTMRFELQIQRPDKFSFFDFSNLENLFKSTTDAYFSDFLAREFDKIFFFSIDSVDENKLNSKPQIKNFYRFGVNNYWQGLSTSERYSKKIFYNNLPKLINIKKEMNLMFPFELLK